MGSQEMENMSVTTVIRVTTLLLFFMLSALTWPPAETRTQEIEHWTHKLRLSLIRTNFNHKHQRNFYGTILSFLPFFLLFLWMNGFIVHGIINWNNYNKTNTFCIKKMFLSVPTKVSSLLISYLCTRECAASPSTDKQSEPAAGSNSERRNWPRKDSTTRKNRFVLLSTVSGGL